MEMCLSWVFCSCDGEELKEVDDMFMMDEAGERQRCNEGKVLFAY